MSDSKFKLVSNYSPQGDQGKAISQLTKGIEDNFKFQCLLGVTGSGKTYTIANVIQNVGLPTLVLAPNKTLAAQLCNEFKEFFPGSAVEFFVSYYDYYQPEAYIPGKDLYIEKDTSINEEIEKLRLSSTNSLYTRDDVIVVASVSCIYGLGSPSEYGKQRIILKAGEEFPRDELIGNLVNIRYERNEYDFVNGKFRVKGDTIEIYPAYQEKAVRVQLIGDEIERIVEFDPVSGEIYNEYEVYIISPATHFLATVEWVDRALATIEEELEERLKYFKEQNKLLEAQRLESRTRYDMEMIRELGFCSGIENYSRHILGKAPGEPPNTLLDFFPDDFLVVIDESHIAVPQIRGMYEGDRSRKQTLVDYGFRLPSALDNRPLKFEEFEAKIKRAIFTTATPGPYERRVSSQIVEQIIRPTGLIDPEVSVRKTRGQIDDLIYEIKKVVDRGERVLVTTLTKRMAEDLTDYLTGRNIRVRYLHSTIDTLERIEILRGLRTGEFDVLVGINLLREGLDLPEVSLVAILDADKEGFLRSEISLIQTIGRAARNVNGKVIMYADDITDSIKNAVLETNRRRELQIEYNREHKITPKTINKAISDILYNSGIKTGKEAKAEFKVSEKKKAFSEDKLMNMSPSEIAIILSGLEEEMSLAARELNFEKAAAVRDEIKKIKKITGIEVSRR
ncbi:MAG: excinuclease ABC subunit UvrB [Candidatus Humimicrobiaceae bacterium]|jgi:excinuclease ABC subunit B|nr:excinuclease ABC subunit UvrB [Actinomycetota bacterium]MDY0027689.1 excinuclease ABC subunit UvrB [Candidatus Humimicrobiaceae bacterium]